MNLDDENSKGTHWVSLFTDKNLAIYYIIEYVLAGETLPDYTNLFIKRMRI